MPARNFLIYNIILRSDALGITRIEKECDIKQRRFFPASWSCASTKWTCIPYPSVGGMICEILLVSIKGCVLRVECISVQKKIQTF